jgi:hypothetical protein
MEEQELSTEELEQLEEQQREEERRYFNVSRSISAGLIFSLPLVAIYELGVVLMGEDINAAALLMKTPLSFLRRHPTEIFGADVMLIVNLLMILVVAIAAWRLWRKDALHGGTFGGMLLEGTIYALLLGPLALAPLTGEFQFGGFKPHLDGFLQKAVVACGAGFYEEAFFRFILLGAIFYLSKELGGMKPFTSALLALVISGAIFSAAHFLSPGEEADLGAFIFRLAAGILLGIIFFLRGFGVAAWTHALFDLYILCFAAQ